MLVYSFLRFWFNFLHFLQNMSKQEPKGGRDLVMSLPCLESQGCHLIPSFYLLSCYAAQSCCSFCFSFFVLLLAQSPAYFPEITSNLCFSSQAFQYFCFRFFFFQQLGDDKLVGNKRSMLPYGTGMTISALDVCIFFDFLMSVDFFKHVFVNWY